MRFVRGVLGRTTAIIALTVSISTIWASAPAAHALPLGRCVHAQGYTIICVDE